MSFSTGETVGRFRITEQLGQGGMATVYRAYDANLDRYVAIKVLHQVFQEDRTFLARFRREAQIIAKLRHPHIIAIHEFAEHNGQPYLVMEFIEGETLKARLSRKPFSLEETMKTLDAVADALTYAHQQGILHRDIKPSNIMLDTVGTPYLTDFGLARMVQAGESTMSQDMMLGTPQYISPEQAQGIKELGPTTDIYSLGIVLYQLVVGRVPFSADTPYAIVHDHIYKPLPIPSQINPEVPPEIERVLLKALAKEPADRFQTASEMAKAFREAVTESQLEQLAPQKVTGGILAVADQMITPAAVIPAPAPTDPISMPPAMQTAGRRGRTLWMLGGLGVFVFTCIIALFVAVLAITNPELQPGTNEMALLDVTNMPTNSNNVPQLSEEEARQQLEQNPNDPALRFALAYALLQNNNIVEARAELANAVGLAGDDPALITSVVQYLASQGHLVEAVRLYIQVADELDNATMRSNAGILMYQVATQAQQRDILMLRRLIDDASNAGAHAMLGRAYITLNQLDRAESEIDTALSINGTLPETHLILGELHLARGRLDDARTEWQYAATAPEAPAWVIARASTLLDQHAS